MFFQFRPVRIINQKNQGGIAMKIIDAHLHFRPGHSYFDEIAVKAGHINTEEHLKNCFTEYGICGGIVMGNQGLSPERNQYPSFLHYCVGVDADRLTGSNKIRSLDQTEENLKRENCVGIKLYPGYSPVSINDSRYEPIYELAAAYRKPVAVHMGQTAGSHAFLKYSHPLTMDEAAVLHPHVQFVMCHFGNPWLMDAAAVIEKNENVAADLSGLLEGKLNMELFLKEQHGYIEALRTWISYVSDYEKIMFGTDWPLPNYENYISFISQIIPERFQDDVFFKSAERIYGCRFN